jgi:LysR family nod box-dependent transcriptional activator
MRFNKLDLNLLVALNAFLTDQNISRAAERIHLSQPAASNALARLRAYFDDELLVPSGRQLILTPRAKSLIEPVREVLMRIESTITAQPEFDPSSETRAFTLLVSDFTTTVFVPAFLERIYQEAPGVRIDLRMQNDRATEMLEQGDADFLIIPLQYVSKDHPSVQLFEEEYVCVTWSGNSKIREELRIDDYLACGHALTHLVGTTRRPALEDWFLERFGVTRRVEVTAQTLAALPSLVVGTDRIATVHRRLAERVRHQLPIKIWEPPLEIPKLIQMLQWHKYRSKDLALSWLRKCAEEVGRRI